MGGEEVFVNRLMGIKRIYTVKIIKDIGTMDAPYTK